MTDPVSLARIGVYVDVSNLHHNGGAFMRYKVLRQFACRDGSKTIRLNAYASYDEERAQTDIDHKKSRLNYFATMRDYGFKVIQKSVRWYIDEHGKRYGKANLDLEMAVDILLQSKNLDRVMLVTGDGDFTQVVRALQNQGCLVEVLAFDNVSSILRREADMFFSGYLVPNLLPASDSPKPWGQIGSRIRGLCYHHDSNESYGFLRFLPKISVNLWNTDTRDPASPYDSVFFHDSALSQDFDRNRLPSRNIIFEGPLTESPENDKPKLTEMQEMSPPPATHRTA